MRTTVTLQDDLLDDLMRFSQAATRTEAVNRAVREWVRLKRIETLRSMRGKVRFDGDLESLRRLEIEETVPTP